MATERRKNGFFNVIARFIKYNRRLILVLLVFTVLVYIIVFGNKGILQRVRLESEKKDLHNQLNEEIKKTEELQNEIEDLHNSDEKIEKVAREKYGMTKEGEKIYKIIIDTAQTEDQ
jgi:cell division protein FtsB